MKTGYILFVALFFTLSVQAKDKLKTVFVQTAKNTNIFDIYTFPAKVIPIVKSTIFSQSEGVIQDFKFNLGQKVYKGQKIIKIKRIDPVYNYKPYFIKAPIDGVISEVHSHIGAQVSKSSKIISIINPNKKRIVLEATVADVKFIKPGVTGFYGDKDNLQKVVVIGVSPVVDTLTGTSRVELEFSSIKNSLPIGSLLKIQFKLNKHKGIILPVDVLTYKLKIPHLRVVDAKTNKVHRVEVKKVRRAAGMIEITSGLKENDLVVIRSSGFLKDGSKVKVASNKEKSKDKKGKL